MKEIQKVILESVLVIFLTANALGQTVTGKATFNVLAPTIDFIGTINGSIAYDTNYIGSHDGIKCLHFGGSFNNGAEIHGIDYVATNVDVNGIDQITSFGFFAVQTIGNLTRTWTKTDGSVITTNETGLDNTYPYQDMGNGDGTVSSDSPGVGYTSNYLTNVVQFSVSNNFRTAIMFQCFDCMPVPMKEISWNWSGVVSLTNGDWILTSSNAIITVNNHRTTEFPVWTNAVHNTP